MRRRPRPSGGIWDLTWRANAELWRRVDLERHPLITNARLSALS
jgi:hypothetical protein